MILALHVLVSLVALGAGFPLIRELLANRPTRFTQQFFLWTTLWTSVSGFLLPFHGLKPGHIFGLLTFALLAAALELGRRAYVVGTLTSLYLNWIVFFVQLFEKTPGLDQVAFLLGPTQLALLGVYVGIIWKADRSYQPALFSGQGEPSFEGSSAGFHTTSQTCPSGS